MIYINQIFLKINWCYKNIFLNNNFTLNYISQKKFFPLFEEKTIEHIT